MAQLHFGAGDSSAFGTTSGGSGTATLVKSNLSNMQIGDLLVAWIHNQSSAVGATLTGPSGWTRYGAAVGTPTNSASRISGFYYYALKSQADITAIPASVVWTFSDSATRVACVVARATGIDLDNIEDSASTSFTTSGGSTSLAIAAITTVKATTLLVGGLHHQNSASTSSPTTTSFMTAFQEYKTAPSGSALANTGGLLGYKDLTTAGTTGTITATYDSAVSAHGGELVAFKAGSWSPPAAPNPGIALKYTSAVDTLSTGHLYYTSATDTISTPAEVRPVPTGYPSVTTMLATMPFYIAHRGGSVNWPEMSLHSYTQSVFWGVGAVELSMARTSDGVWFGLHDATLDRTSGTSGFTASAHTWAEVQAFQITSAGTTHSTDPARPYMRWEEIIASYYGTHIIFVDPKVASSFRIELLDMMDALPGTPTDHFVAKYYGVSSGWPFDASARGYKTWGYFYQADAANFAAYQARWDILGMDYNADQTTWNSILSYGKPVIGHITPSAVAATSALTKGAVGLMVSGVEQVVPRTP